MDFTTLKTRVSELLGNDTAGMLTKIGNWLNFVQHNFAHELDFPDLLTSATIASVAGQQTYGLPTDMDRIKSIVWQGDAPRVLSPLSVEDYSLQVPHAITANDYGEPTYYILLGGLNFSVYPVPNTVKNFVFRYYKHPTDMSAGSDTPAFSSHYHHELIWGAYYWGKTYEGDEQARQSALQDYQGVFRRLKRSLRKSRRELRGMTSIQDLRTADNDSFTGR